MLALRDAVLPLGRMVTCRVHFMVLNLSYWQHDSAAVSTIDSTGQLVPFCVVCLFHLYFNIRLTGDSKLAVSVNVYLFISVSPTTD